MRRADDQRRTPRPLVWVVALWTAAGVVAQAHSAPCVYVLDGLTRVRPHDPPRPAASARIQAARNEFEPFQVAVWGGDQGLRQDGVAAQQAWVWKNFTGGQQCLFMDP